MPKYKIARIASDIQRYLGEILINEVNDEILKSITITGCDVTNDLSYCKIYFTSIMDMDEKAWNELGIKTKYYNTDLHKGAFYIPNYVIELLGLE